MAYIDEICFPTRSKPRVVLTKSREEKGVSPDENPKTFIQMRFYMLNQLFNLAAAFVRFKNSQNDFLLDSLLPFTLTESADCQLN